MRATKRYLRRAFADPGSAVSVIVGVLVGAVLGGAYEPRPPPTPPQPAGTACTKAPGTISTNWRTSRPYSPECSPDCVQGLFSELRA
jgi:hypothetical protein